LRKNSQASHTYGLIYQGIYRRILQTSQLTCWTWTKCHHLRMLYLAHNIFFL